MTCLKILVLFQLNTYPGASQCGQLRCSIELLCERQLLAHCSAFAAGCQRPDQTTLHTLPLIGSKKRRAVGNDV